MLGGRFELFDKAKKPIGSWFTIRFDPVCDAGIIDDEIGFALPKDPRLSQRHAEECFVGHEVTGLPEKAQRDAAFPVGLLHEASPACAEN